jgi:hypothetical protein
MKRLPVKYTQSRRHLRILPPKLCVAALFAVALLGAAGFMGSWLEVLDGEAWPVVTASFLALGAAAGMLAGMLWDWRARAARRRQAVFDMYADLEIARELNRRAGYQIIPPTQRRLSA